MHQRLRLTLSVAVMGAVPAGVMTVVLPPTCKSVHTALFDMNREDVFIS